MTDLPSSTPAGPNPVAEENPAVDQQQSSPPPLPPIIAQARVATRWQWSHWAIWLIPLIAAGIGGWIVLQAWVERGTSITISFKSAEGLEAGKTKIKYKDVDIGNVKTISLSKDRSHVIVTAKLAKGAEGFLRDDTRFWVVRPRIGAAGISGLGTLLSGSYIGVDVGKSEQERDDFVGVDTPPIIVSGTAGRHYVLHAEQIGSLDVGAPIYFRHIQVGEIDAYELDKNGQGITLNIFVNAPYDKYVTENALFWHASGVGVSLDASGVKLQTESLAAIISGGIAFEPQPHAPSAGPAAAGSAFPLFPTREKALQRPDTVVRKVLLYFNESVRGLAPGAPVDFRGIVIGDVQGVSLEYDQKAKIYRFPVEVNIYPERLRSRYRAGAEHAPGGNEDTQKLMERLVANGLRAQLKTGNLVTGMLFVALDFFPDAPKVKVDFSRQPLVLATVPGALEELQASLTRIARKIEKLPLDDISGDLRTALASLNATLNSADKTVKRFDADVLPKATETLEQVRKTLAGVDHTLADDAPLQQDLRETLREITRAAQALRNLSEMAERHPEVFLRGKKEDRE